jgi:dTMP kinase
MSIFVTLEGPDGAGKTTQLNLLKPIAQQEGWVLTRNPGGTPFGERLRELLLNDRSVHLHQIAELLLYMADRTQHMKEVVEPALKEGKVVICDRFIDSTVAYQGFGRGLNVELINQLNGLATHNIKPDLTILLDINPEQGLGRAKSGDKIEAEGSKFQAKVRAGFLELAGAEPKRFTVIDAGNNNIQEVHQLVLEAIKNKINK